MQRTLLVFLFSAATCLAGDPEHFAFKELSDLIHSLPSRELLLADVALFKNGTAPPNDKQRDAIPRLQKAREGFERLKALLSPGTSVFDYPGLLSLARAEYSEVNGSYSMVLGIPPGWNWTKPQGINENEFRLKFDGHGLITELSPVLYKH